MSGKGIVFLLLAGGAAWAGWKFYEIVGPLLKIRSTIGKPYFRNGFLFVPVLLDNPGKKPIRIDSFQGKLYINGVYVSDVGSDSSVYIPAGGTQNLILKIPVSLQALAAIPNVVQSLSAGDQGLNIKIVSTVKSGGLDLPYSINYQI